MYIFNNAAIDKTTKANRNHRNIYPGTPPAFFDLGHQQIQRRTNQDWTRIGVGDLACVVTGTDRNRDPKRISSVYIVKVKPNRTHKMDEASVIRGDLIGEPIDGRRYNQVLRDHGVRHRYINEDTYNFKNGFNVADISSQLDALSIRVTAEGRYKNRVVSVGAIKEILRNGDVLDTGGDANRLEGQENLTEEYEAEEGYRQDRTATFRQRNGVIIRARKAFDDYTCQACGFRLEVDGNFVIDCHHKNPLGLLDNVTVTTQEDLVCLCPTCHRIAHTKRHPLSIEEIRSILENK
jgi:hypothetical protein